MENSPITVIISDNSAVAMTGAQESLAVGRIRNICLGIGTAFGNLGSGYIPVLTGSLQPIYFCIGVVAAGAAMLVFTLPRERRTRLAH